MRVDHDELQIFLEICLIYFTNRSKVKEQKENTSLLKGNLAQNSWVIDAVVGADLRRHGGGCLWH